MDKAFNDNIRPLLDLADKLTGLLKGTEIKLPIIASCGMQSHGKSSTLESITHISLPQGESTVTLCPIKICLRNAKSDKEYARIKFEVESEENYEIINLSEISKKIIEYQNKVKKKNNIPEETKKLFDEVIQVEVNRKNAPNLTLYDLPGLNHMEELQKDSEEINEKYLKQEETTVLWVTNSFEEIYNYHIVRWMKNIPNYQKRFNPILTKVDYYVDNPDKSIGLRLEEINSLGLKNKPALIINRAGSNLNLSYEEMEKKELEMINEINNINNYPNIYKGVGELVNHLIELQREYLELSFPDLITKINREITINENELNKLPKECKNERDFFDMFYECMDNFSKILEKKMYSLKCENGVPEENLMKYHIHIKFREIIENTKIKMSQLFTKPFCDEVTHNIIQSSVDNISILEDKVPFNQLIKPKIINILSDFETTILDIFDYMTNQIYSLIDNAFGFYKNLKYKVETLFKDYANEQKEKVQNFYKEIYYLETENVLTYNNDLVNKLNSLNKEINYSLLGKKLKRIKEEDEEEEDKKENNIKNNNIENEKNNNKIEENIKDKIELKEEEKNGNILNKKKKKKMLKRIAKIKDDIFNNDFGEIVKKSFLGTSNITSSLIRIVSNYENEVNARYFDSNEFTGRLQIAYRPEEISTTNERIKNPDLDKFYDETKYEFIPGFQYIEKDKLDEFKKLIKEGKIEIKTANVITKMVTYLEIMLNRVLDMIFLNIKKYLYDKLTDKDMINHIKKEIHLLKFEECKNLVEISPEVTNKRKKYTDNIQKFKEAKIMVSKLKEINMQI